MFECTFTLCSCIHTHTHTLNHTDVVEEAMQDLEASEGVVVEEEGCSHTTLNSSSYTTLNSRSLVTCIVV